MDNALFVAPRSFLPEIVLHQFFWLHYLAWEIVQQPTRYLYLDKINNLEWRLNLI